MVKRHLRLKLMDQDLESSDKKYTKIVNMVTYDEGLEPEVME